MWMGLVQVEWMPCRFDAAREAVLHAVEHARLSGDRSLLMDAMTLQVGAELLGSTSPVEGRPLLDALRAEFGRGASSNTSALVQEASSTPCAATSERARRWIRESEAVAERFGAELWALRAGSSAVMSR